MPPQRPRRKGAKVEGRDPPETAKETMAPFRALTTRLLKVPINEVKEQQRLFEEMRGNQDTTLLKTKKKLDLRRTQVLSKGSNSEKDNRR